MKRLPALDHCAALFSRCGGTDEAYLRCHWQRFVQTRGEIERTRALPEGSRILDVGAHWLHQSSIYALEGMCVTALDLPVTLAMPRVVHAAAELGIDLLANDDLEHVPALRDVPADRFDLVLFTEVIEHITFNPVALWRELHRVTRPGGRIVVTTPNYGGLRRRLRRIANRSGGGLDVASILNLRTYAHHWKEYSMRELLRYFSLLSPDFRVLRACWLPEPDSANASGARRLALGVEAAIPWLRPSLHLELELGAKTHGIAIEPHW